MDDCYTFREQLAIRYPTHGHALWEPDPGGLYDAVDVGDVGFIRDGIFYRLFNALLPVGDPSNPDPQRSRNYPPQLQPRITPHIRTSRDDCRCFYSKNATKVSHAHESDVYASGPDDPQVTFSCSGRRGALSYLPFSAERKDTVARGDFSRWMVRNIDSCMRVAEDLGLGVTHMEDIILVTGCHLAKSWVNVTFSKSQGDAQVSFGVRRTGHSGVQFEEGDVNGGDVKVGPSGENLPENQCIFVRGYRVIRILNIWPKLRGLVGPHRMHRGTEPGSDRRLELISVRDDAEDPLRILFEYMVEQARGCDMVLIHDDDLECIDGAPQETLQPDTLMGFLRNHAPVIHQVQCEVLSRRKGRSGAEAIATVATLSKAVFEELQSSGLSGSSPISQFRPRPPCGKHTCATGIKEDKQVEEGQTSEKGREVLAPEEETKTSQDSRKASPWAQRRQAEIRVESSHVGNIVRHLKLSLAGIVRRCVRREAPTNTQPARTTIIPRPLRSVTQWCLCSLSFNQATESANQTRQNRNTPGRPRAEELQVRREEIRGPIGEGMWASSAAAARSSASLGKIEM